MGSDLDLVAVIEDCAERFERRSLKWGIHQLPVPAQAIVYTRKEWESLKEQGGSICAHSGRETVWVYQWHSANLR